MYKILGADGKEYGPITVEQLRQWIAEGRANAETQILADGATGWKPLSAFPELTGATAASPPMPGAMLPENQVTGPAVGLMVTAILGFTVSGLSLAMNALGASFGTMAMHHAQDIWVNVFSGVAGVFIAILKMLICGIILFGAVRMKNLRNYKLAIAASILALLPCFSPCCLLGLPMGIWALVVLSKPEVKNAFH